jgi:cyclophilin family peptidyl-prolyl cis-trans isomerase
MRSSHDVRVRRAAARALSRIADSDAEVGLLRALEDEDEETTGWGAYGLGFGCKGKEDGHVRALAARASSLARSGGTGRIAAEDASSARSVIDPHLAIARAVGRCGSTLAEQVLASWVRSTGPMSIPAAYGLGDVARAHGGLTDEDATALLEGAESAREGMPAALAYLYPFGRAEQVGQAWSSRVIELSRRGLTAPSELRSFAIRALSRSGAAAADDLERVVETKDFLPAERAEAARGLSLLGEVGRARAGAAIGRLAPDRDAYRIMTLAGDEFQVLLTIIEALGDKAAPKESVAGLQALAALTAPGDVPPVLARRIAGLRCAAAVALANGAYDADVLAKCDADGSETKERARLAALLRRPLLGERRVLWASFAKSPHVRLREAALEAIARHAELGDSARAALIEAMASPLPGVVATATDIIKAHPDRLMTLSAKEIRDALNPAAPPPTVNPSREIDHAAAKALESALARPWSEDLVETRVGLLDAAAAVRLPVAHEAAEKACHESNATVREHAQKDLRALGDTASVCALPHAPNAVPTDGGQPIASADPPLSRSAKVVFQTDAGELSIVFEPELAPAGAARFVALARRGFYKNTIVHRVVPGFVAQFGDPGGDGYGGSGSLLRCETSPVPFEPLDVGVALAGRDTGSSQLFVTLARYPHLDGEYARVGRAQGDWAALAEGDAIRDVKVEE